MRMRVLLLILFAGGAGILACASEQARTPVPPEQSLRQLFERARLLEETNQNLARAIQLYEQVVSKAKEQRALAAKAQLQIALIYERLGRKEEAQRAFRAVVKDFSDQIEIVRQARAKIIGPNGSPDSVTSTRKVWNSDSAWGAPSPDGRLLTFVDWTTGDLAIRDLTTGQSRRITKKNTPSLAAGFALTSVFSPDSKQVAYAWSYKESYYDLRVCDLDGSNSRILYHDEQSTSVHPWEWSKDGKHILTSFQKKDGTSQIALVSVADGSARIVKTLDSRGGGRLSLSPDGRYIAYSAFPKEDAWQRDVYVLAADGNRETSLVQLPSDDRVIGWTPDGTGVLFSSDHSGGLDAWLVPVADGKPQGSPVRVKTHIGSPMGLTPKGALFYSLSSSLTDIFVATIDPDTAKLLNPPKAVTKHTVFEYTHAAWSPDGRYLAYVVSEGGGRRFAIQSRETGQERQLPANLHRLFTGRFHWSPDGRSLLVAGFDQPDHHAIFQVDAQTGALTTLVERRVAGELLAEPAPSPDGKAIFYRRQPPNGKGPFLILKREFQTGGESEVFREQGPFNWWAFSPDGRQLALLTDTDKEWNARVLKVVPVAGGEGRELFRVQDPEFLFEVTWSPDGRHLFFSRGADKNEEVGVGGEFHRTKGLWRISQDGGQPQRVDLGPGKLHGPSLHPDGRQIAYAAGEPSDTEVWVVENFLKGCSTLPSDMVAWWSGDGTALDRAGGINGTLKGGATFAPGKVGQAFKFGRTGDYVEIPFDSRYDFSPKGQFTLEAWVNPGRIGSDYRTDYPWQALVVKSPPDDEWNWGIHQKGDKFTTGSTHQHFLRSSTAVTVGAWYHVAVTYNAGNMALYLNGTREDECSNCWISQSKGNLVLGRKGQSDLRPDLFQGLLDEVALYRRALSASEVQAIYSAGTFGKCKAPAQATR